MKQQREEEGSSVMDMDSCSTRSQLPSLPFDMVTEILCRLHPKPLLRFRCVCKSWRDTIDSHHFILNLHLRRSRAAFPTHLLLQKSNDVLYYEPPASTLRQIRLPFPIDDGNSIWLTSSCNGLLCFLQNHWRKRVFTFHVTNPITRKVVNLPESSQATLSCTCQILWSQPGRDGGGGVYKALLVYQKDKPRLVRSLVCTLGLDVAWRPVCNRFKVWEACNQECMEYPCVNGAAHYVYSSVREKLGGRIAAFDIIHEKFREIRFPPGCCSPEKKCWMRGTSFGSHMPRVVELRGQLALFHMNGGGTLIETWFLTDYFGRVWTKGHTVCLESVFMELRLDMKPTCQLRYSSLNVFPAVKMSDRELVMKIHTDVPSATFCPSFSTYVTHFFSYDPMLRKTKLLGGVKNKRICIEGPYDISGHYVESLVNPCETSNLITKKKKRQKRRRSVMEEGCMESG